MDVISQVHVESTVVAQPCDDSDKASSAASRSSWKELRLSGNKRLSSRYDLWSNLWLVLTVHPCSHSGVWVKSSIPHAQAGYAEELCLCLNT